MKAIVVGGGIGGLSAAICLQKHGWRVRVLERALSLGEVGAGVQLGPNGTRILQGMGVMERLADAVFTPEGIEMRHGASGRRIMFLPLGDTALQRWGAPYVQVYRPDLIEALKRTLLAHDGDALRTGAEVTGYVQSGDSVSAVVSAGKTESGDMLIAADGVHSALRAQMLGPQPARFTGNVAWRGVVEADRLGDYQPPPTGCIWTGPGRHAVTTRMRGGRLVNFVGIVEQADWQEEGWSIPGRRADALALFGWNPVLRHILDQAPKLYRWALLDRAPLARWSDGRVMLLGDAAHPMLPSLAQGAVQAIEDAEAIAKAVQAQGDPVAAGRAYFARRIARATRVQAESAANLRLFHRRSGAAQLASYAPIWLAGKIAPQLLLRRNDWLFAPRREG